MAVFAHQANLRDFAVFAELLRSVDGEQHGFVLAVVRAVFRIPIPDPPNVLILNDEVAGCRHDRPLDSFEARRHPTPGRDGGSWCGKRFLWLLLRRVVASYAPNFAAIFPLIRLVPSTQPIVELRRY